MDGNEGEDGMDKRMEGGRDGLVSGWTDGWIFNMLEPISEQSKYKVRHGPKEDSGFRQVCKVKGPKTDSLSMYYHGTPPNEAPAGHVSHGIWWVPSEVGGYLEHLNRLTEPRGLFKERFRFALSFDRGEGGSREKRFRCVQWEEAFACRKCLVCLLVRFVLFVFFASLFGCPSVWPFVRASVCLAGCPLLCPSTRLW